MPRWHATYTERRVYTRALLSLVVQEGVPVPQRVPTNSCDIRIIVEVIKWPVVTALPVIAQGISFHFDINFHFDIKCHFAFKYDRLWLVVIMTASVYK